MNIVKECIHRKNGNFQDFTLSKSEVNSCKPHVLCGFF